MYLNSLTFCPVNAEGRNVAALLVVDDDDVVSGVLSSEMTERSSLGCIDVALATCLVFERSPTEEAPDLTERSTR